MKNRYTVVFGRQARYEPSWHERSVRTFKTLDRAVRFATMMGDRHGEQTRTFGGRFPTCDIQVRDAKTNAPLWLYEPRVVPSVGELGVW